jgi:type I restriction enzyme S subunit
MDIAQVPSGYKLTGLGVLPEEWEVVSIGQIADVKGGKRLPLGKALTSTPTPHPYIRLVDVYPGGVSLEEIKYVPIEVFPAIKNYRIYTSDLFITVTGNTLGIIGKIPEALNGANLTENADKLTNIKCDRDYLLLVMLSPMIQSVIESIKTVGAQPKLALERIRTIQIPLPSLAEQQAIAAALGEMDALLTAQRARLTKQRVVKQGLLQGLLSSKQRLPGFAGEWEVKRLGEVLKFQVGSPFSSTYFNQAGDGLRLIKNRDLKSDDSIYYYSGPFGSEFIVQDDDVLIGMDGDFLPCLWNKGKAILNQRVGRVVTNSKADRTFCYYVLAKPLQDIQTNTGATTVKHLSHKDIESISLPLPEIAEQRAIAAVLSEADAYLAALEAEHAKTQLLKQGMMQNLLTGKLRLV